MSRRILVIDDERSIRDTLRDVLADEGFSTRLAASGEEGLSFLRKEGADLVLLDIWMPGTDGIHTLQLIRKEFPQQLVLMMSGHGTIETAVKAVKLGAFDFIEKPLSLDRLLVLVHNAVRMQALAEENHALKAQVERSHEMVGRSSAFRKMQEMIRRAAPTTGSVLITGENGTGKEVVARHLHALSNRKGGPFIEVNCAAIPEGLIESELFGHTKGAFTGADQMKRGKFDLADGGTIFLDEIGDMSLTAQAKVLRILQEKKFERVGGSETIPADVRVIAATNKDLKLELQAGRFRTDLYHRLNVVPFHLPPLRERKEDIPELADHFLRIFNAIHGKAVGDPVGRGFSVEAERLLDGYSWPGNIRELKNVVERIIILSTDAEHGTPVSAQTVLTHLHDDDRTALSTAPGMERKAGEKLDLRELRKEFERNLIRMALRECEGNVSKAAVTLGIERSHLHKKMKDYGIDSAEFSEPS